jgi:hypothetical protein
MSNPINPHMSTVNSHMSNVHFHTQHDSDMMPDNYEQSKTDGGKMGKIFSCFASNSVEGISEKCNDIKSDAHPSTVKSQKTEYYPFDHGDSKYYHTTDKAPLLKSDNAAEKVHRHATKFWAEVFGTLNIGVTFFLVFFIQLYR